MDKVLVTGGAGYIGSITAKVLSESDYTPVIFDNLEAGHPEAVQDFQLIEGDLRDPQKIQSALQKIKPNAVMHFAAYLNVDDSVKNPYEYFHNNVYGSLNLFRAMRADQINKLIFSSTCATYGQPQNLPVTENEPEKPESPYGESKLMTEKIFEWAHTAYNLNSIRLRCFNVAGAWPDGSVGEDKQPFKTIVLITITSALKNTTFTLYGDDYGPPDGTCIRDYIHVVDLAQTHVDAFNALKDGMEGTDYYNVGIGKGYSNKEIIQKVRGPSGKDFPVKIGPRRLGDPAQIYADNTKVKQELGWQPKYNLDEIIRSAWEWHSSQPDGY